MGHGMHACMPAVGMGLAGAGGISTKARYAVLTGWRWRGYGEEESVGSGSERMMQMVLRRKPARTPRRNGRVLAGFNTASKHTTILSAEADGELRRKMRWHRSAFLGRG